jgi:peptidoglycan/xylan/chitin deacetylase (PgdA/CDA1 family)
MLVGLAVAGAGAVILLDRGQEPPEPASAAAASAPIFTYHAISQPPAGAKHPELFVAPGAFAAQMDWLREQRFEAVTLEELHQGWEEGSPLPPRPVVISFDDGLQTQFTEAFPVLNALRWPAVLNLKVESIRQGELTEAMIGRMIAAGWEVDSHTITHPRLTRLGDRKLEREVAGSRRILQRRLRMPVDFFCYPYGELDAHVVDAVREAGYLGATTTRPGLASSTDDRYQLPRLGVDSTANLDDLAAELGELEPAG